MLSDYKETEPIIYKQLKNSKKNLSHAYLFNLNGNVYAMDMIMSFIKEILCHEHKSKEEYEKLLSNVINSGFEYAVKGLGLSDNFKKSLQEVKDILKKKDFFVKLKGLI